MKIVPLVLKNPLLLQKNLSYGIQQKMKHSHQDKCSKNQLSSIGSNVTSVPMIFILSHKEDAPTAQMILYVMTLVTFVFKDHLLHIQKVSSGIIHSMET
jgi:hypothetical protein